jgi:hypothetical protein
MASGASHDPDNRRAWTATWDTATWDTVTWDTVTWAVRR